MKNGQEKKHRVAFTVFRNELANYLEMLSKGEEITVMDAKRGREIVVLKKVKTSK